MTIDDSDLPIAGSSPVGRRLARVAGALSALLTILIVGAMLWFCRYGFTFDDEGFAMVWTSTPGLFAASVTEFGFVYHPLFWLLGHDIALFRQVVLFSLFLSAWTLIDLELRRHFGFGPRLKFLRLAASAGLAVSSLTWYELWLLAPSYNTMCLQALIVIAIGVLLFDDDSARKSLAGALLIGTGGWLAFLAKPTTAAVAAVIVLVWIFAARSFRLRLVLIAVGVAAGLTFASAFLIDGSIAGFVDRLRLGSDLASDLDAGHSLAESFRLESYDPGVRLFAVTLLITATLMCASMALSATTWRCRSVWSFPAVVAAGASAAASWGHLHDIAFVNRFHASMLLAIPAAALLAGVALGGMAGVRSVSAGQWTLGLGFLIFPYAYAFGTNTDYWQSGGAAAVFWVLGGVIFLLPARHHPRLPIVVLAFALTAELLVGTMLLTGSRTPYRQPQVVGKPTVPTTMGANGSTLRLTPDIARYVKESTSRSKAAGFRPGIPIIDLTGKSPGTLFVLGAKAIAQPWTIGGYPGSEKAAIVALNLVPCRQIGTAWLLVEPGGPRSISPAILDGFGVDIAKDYEVVATWKTAKGMGGFESEQIQQLLKPTRSAADGASACVRAKTDQ